MQARRQAARRYYRRIRFLDQAGLAALLRAAPGDDVGRIDRLVFGQPHLGTPLERSRLLKRYKAAAKAAGIRDVCFHDLRHTFGTRMAAAGVPMRTLQEWMGHRDYKTTLIYADYAPIAHERELVEREFGSSGATIGDRGDTTNTAMRG
jgi:integrase